MNAVSDVLEPADLFAAILDRLDHTVQHSRIDIADRGQASYIVNSDGVVLLHLTNKPTARVYRPSDSAESSAGEPPHLPTGWKRPGR